MTHCLRAAVSPSAALMKLSLSPCCLVVALSGAAPAAAIIMRHDVDQSQCVVLGHQHRASLVQLELPSRDGSPLLFNGTGTLIAPNWVATAAHAVDASMQGKGLPGR